MTNWQFSICRLRYCYCLISGTWCNHSSGDWRQVALLSYHNFTTHDITITICKLEKQMILCFMSWSAEPHDVSLWADDTYHTSLEPRPQHVAMMMRARHRAINSALWCNTKHNSATFYCTLDNFHTGSSVKRVSNVKWIFMRNEQLVTYCCSNSSFLVNLVPETWYPVHYGEPEEAGSRAKVSRKLCGTQ